VRRVLLVLGLVALASCSWIEGDQKPVRTSPLYSPNGEPLSGGQLGEPTCEDALRNWFARVDTEHLGAIDEREFLADANRQFTAMDLDKTGVLTPDVLARYRAPYMNPNAARRTAYDIDVRPGHDRGPAPQLDVEDPVMEADVDLRNRVTRDDFLAYARRNFASLDSNHDGRLERAEVLATCDH
jgi:hypothetical protein